MLHPYVSQRNTDIIRNKVCNNRVYSGVAKGESESCKKKGYELHYKC